MEERKLDLSILDSLTVPKIDVKTEEKIEDIIPEVDSISSMDDNLIAEESEKIIEDQNELEEEVEVEDDSNENDESEESAIKLWATFASERGLIDIKDDEEIEDSEEFLVKKYNERVEKAVDSYINSLPDELKTIIEAYKLGVPIDNYLEIESRISDYASVNAEKLKEDVELQKNIMKAFLRTQEYDDTEISEKIERYEENLLLEDEASSALKKLVKIEQRQKEKMLEDAKKQRIVEEKQYEERLTNFKNTVMAKEEIIKGIPVTKEQREAIINITTKPVALKDGVPITALKKMELEDPDFLIKLAYMASLNWDLSTIERKAATKAVRTIKKSVDGEPKPSSLGKMDLNLIRKAVKQNRNSMFTNPVSKK